MIVFTGATGHLGSRTLTALLEQEKYDPKDIVIMTNSDVSKIPSIAREKGVRVEKGSNQDVESMNRIFAMPGADTLFLVSYPSPSVERWEHHARAIDCAASPTSNIRTIIYTSLMFGGPTGLSSCAGVQQAHIKTIHHLTEKCKESNGKLEYVVVREGIYAESWWLYAGFQEMRVRKGKGKMEWVIPDDGPVAWVTWDDLGLGTAKILANYKTYLGQTLRLTGPRATSISDVADLVRKYSGREVEVKIVGEDEAREYHLKKGSVPKEAEWQVVSWSGWHKGIKDGETAVVDPLLEELLGRKPRGIEECAEELFTPIDE